MRSAILAGLSATFYVSLFPPFDHGWAAWLALVPLVVAARAGTGFALVAGWLFGSLAALGLVAGWLSPALTDFFGASTMLRLALLTLASQLGGGLPLIVFGLVAARARACSPAVRVAGIGAAWVAVEYGRAQLPYAIPWAPLGAALPADSAVAQVADLGGVYAVSFVVATVNAAVAEATVSLRSGAPRTGALAAVGVATMVVLSAVAYGVVTRAAVHRYMAAAATARVALVHAELANAGRVGAATAPAALGRYLDLSPAPAPDLDLVVWPENAVSVLLEENPELVARIAARAGSVPYLVGAPRSVVVNGRPSLRTSALLIVGGTVAEAYDKRRLLPFAETMPELRHAGRAEPDGYGAGDDAVVIRTGALRLGPLICYEAIFPDLARATVNAGADLLVNPSNDSWFSSGGGPLQHARFTELRAVELRRTLLRAANRGVTMAMLPDGTRTHATAGDAPGVEVVTVPLLTIRTVYARLGDAFAWICILAAGLVAIKRPATSPRTWRSPRSRRRPRA